MAACPSFAVSSTVVRRAVLAPAPVSVTAQAAQLSLLGNSTMLTPSYSPMRRRTGADGHRRPRPQFYALSSKASVHTMVPSGHSLPTSSPYQPSLLTSILAAFACLSLGLSQRSHKIVNCRRGSSVVAMIRPELRMLPL
jgi:hypothetical protein